MRILALDIGTKTIGLAISDPMGILAQGLTTIKRTNLDEDLKEVMTYIKEYNVELLLAGKPYHMNGDEGKSVQMVMNFANRLRDMSGMDLIYQDERLSTVSAEKVLIESKVRRENRKKYVDKIAATYILQTYLDGRSYGNNHFD